MDVNCVINVDLPDPLEVNFEIRRKYMHELTFLRVLQVENQKDLVLLKLMDILHLINLPCIRMNGIGMLISKSKWKNASFIKIKNSISEMLFKRLYTWLPDIEINWKFTKPPFDLTYKFDNHYPPNLIFNQEVFCLKCALETITGMLLYSEIFGQKSSHTLFKIMEKLFLAIVSINKLKGDAVFKDVFEYQGVINIVSDNDLPKLLNDCYYLINGTWDTLEYNSTTSEFTIGKRDKNSIRYAIALLHY